MLDNLAAGFSAAEIVKSYPTLQEADVQAVLGYAAELAREQFVPLLPGGVVMLFKVDENLPLDVAERPVESYRHSSVLLFPAH